MGASLEQTLADLEAAIAGMSEPEFAAAPAGKWSIGEILEHLSITYVTSNDRLFSKILTSGPSFTPQSLKQRVATFAVTTLGYLPSGRKAPEFTRPKGRPTAEILADIRRALPEMESGL